MSTSNKTYSEHSGRATGVAVVDSGWLVAVRIELAKVARAVVSTHGEVHTSEALHAAEWTEQWLLAYASGWCELKEMLDCVKRCAALLPNGIEQRALLGVAAHKALLVNPRHLGEQRARTRPHVVYTLGAQVQGFAFNDDGQQMMTIKEAATMVREFVTKRDLLPDVPSVEQITQYHTDWREREVRAGQTVPRPRSGRPAKK